MNTLWQTLMYKLRAIGASYTLLAALLFGAGLWWLLTPAMFHKGCLKLENGLVICANSDMARFHQTQAISADHDSFDLQDKRLTIEAARNESISFQLMLRSTSDAITDPINIIHSNWRSDKKHNTAAQSKAKPDTTLHLAHYHFVNNGGYQWGPKSEVLTWPAAYPDALIPQVKQCGTAKNTLFDAVKAPDKDTNQAVWVETFVPAETPAGLYRQTISLNIADTTVALDVELTVHAVTLPQKPSIAAVGEIYRSYKLEGAGENPNSDAWRDMSYCYQQLAHQHRMVFIERYDEQPIKEDWAYYQAHVEPLLSGALFSDAFNYTGTGKNVAVSTWRTPWPQQFNVSLQEPLSESTLSRYTDMAAQWDEWLHKNNFSNTYFFAYVFDELDGPRKPDVEMAAYQQYIAMVHEQMGELQKAIDKGTTFTSLDLLWTSHSNPAQWQNDTALDLTGKIRLWAPNASAADVTFLQKRIKAGEQAWFYHSGHPAIGIHSINASGSEMRTWGIAAARYGFQGQLMWAVNLGNDDLPFAQPSYKPEDDRFGNGVMVYPGNQLDKIGFKASPGPIASMRLKAWRRGLQDAELFFLAMQKNPQKAQRLITEIMPAALSEGRKKAAWPSDAASWMHFRSRLLELASK